MTDDTQITTDEVVEVEVAEGQAPVVAPTEETLTEETATPAEETEAEAPAEEPQA